MITSNSRTLHRVDTALHGGMTNLQDTEPGALLTEADFPTTRRFPRTAAEAFRDDAYANAMDGSPREQPDPFASFEAFLDWIDARWKTWFAFGIAAGVAFALITLFFAKGGTPQ